MAKTNSARLFPSLVELQAFQGGYKYLDTFTFNIPAGANQWSLRDNIALAFDTVDWARRVYLNLSGSVTVQLKSSHEGYISGAMTLTGVFDIDKCFVSDILFTSVGGANNNTCILQGF